MNNSSNSNTVAMRACRLKDLFRMQIPQSGRVDSGRQVVLKTIRCKSSAGSNPVPSAIFPNITRTYSSTDRVLGFGPNGGSSNLSRCTYGVPGVIG